MKKILFISIFTFMSSCSSILMTRPPRPEVWQPLTDKKVVPNCSTSKAPPIIDFVIGIPLLIEGVSILVVGPVGPLVGIGASELMLGLGFIGSGADGNGIIKDCREYKDYIEEWNKKDFRYRDY